MNESKEREFVCKFCNKKFPSGKSLGGHIRIHTNEYVVHSDSYNGNRLRRIPKKKKNNKRLVDQREMMTPKQQQQQLCCRECGKGFESLEALRNHMDCHREGEKMMMDSESDTKTYLCPTRKRSKKVMEQSNSESFSNGSSSSTPDIDQEVKNAALTLMMLSIDSRGHNLVVNSLAESLEKNSELLETKASSEEQVKMISSVEKQSLKTDKIAVDDQLRSTDEDLSDSYSTDSDYFINGSKKSDSDISVDGSLRNTGFGSEFNRFRNGDELGVKEGRSKYELRKSKSIVLPSYESDYCADTNSKIHRSNGSKSPMVKKASGANKNSNSRECPICFKVFKSGQALGGHKRTHPIENQEHRIKHKAADMPIDLNLPATDIDE